MAAHRGSGAAEAKDDVHRCSGRVRGKSPRKPRAGDLLLRNAVAPINGVPYVLDDQSAVRTAALEVCFGARDAVLDLGAIAQETGTLSTSGHFRTGELGK